MRQRGSLTLGLGIAIALLSGSLAVLGWLYNDSLVENGRITGEYESFKSEAARLGSEAEEKKQKLLADQKRIYDERLASLQKRVAAAAARADGLCKSAGLSAGCRDLPAVPATARPTDDAGHDQRLLAILRHAQNTADQLTELQSWVAAQSQ